MTYICTSVFNKKNGYQLFIPSFNTPILCYREGRLEGGVAIYIRTRITLRQRNDLRMIRSNIKPFADDTG